MAAYVFFECTTPSCRLRFPLDKQQQMGKYCPRCGGKLRETPAEAEMTSAENHWAVPTRRIFGVLDNIRSAYNVGGIFRTADGAGVAHLYLCGITPTPKAHPELTKTALGAEKVVPWSAHANALIVAESLRKEGVFLLGLERRADTIPLQAFSSARLDGQSVGMIIGHERAGVDPSLLAKCDEVVSLPMVGGKASLNVGVAFGIAVYWMTFQLSQNNNLE